MNSLLIKFFTGRTVTILVDGSEKVSTALEKIHEQAKDTLIEDMNLIFIGQRLDENQTLDYYNVLRRSKNSSMILIVQKLPHLLYPTPCLDTPETLELDQFLQANKSCTVFADRNNILAEISLDKGPFKSGYFYVWANKNLDRVEVPLTLRMLTPSANPNILTDPKYLGHIFNLGKFVNIKEHIQVTMTGGPVEGMVQRQYSKRRSQLIFNPLCLVDDVHAIEAWGRKWTQVCAVDKIDFSKLRAQFSSAKTSDHSRELFSQAVKLVESTYQKAFQKKLLALVSQSPALNFFTFFLCLKRMQPNFPIDLKKLIVRACGFNSFWDLIVSS